MNPFFLASAGIFAATGGGSDNITISERICAAVSRVIAGEHDRVLDPAWWRECVGAIPAQVDSGVVRENGVPISGQQAESVVLANLCVSSKFRQATLATLPTALAGRLATLPPLQSLNCLTIALSNTGALQISLAVITINRTASGAGSASVERTETTVNYANEKAATAIKEVFGDLEPLKDEPYYICVRPGR